MRIVTSDSDYLRTVVEAELKPFGLQREISDDELKIVLQLAESSDDSDDNCKIVTRFSTGGGGDDSLGFSFAYDEYHVNIKSSAIFLFVVYFDILTFGVPAGSTIFGLYGEFKKIIAKLDDANGERCSYIECKHLKNIGHAIHYKSVSASISNKVCKYEKFHCKYRNNDGICSITFELVENNLRKLIEKGALYKKGSIYSLPL